jgi:hypothetical protein
VSLASAGVATAAVTISASASTPLGSYDVLIVGKDSTGEYVHTLGLTAIVGVLGTAPQGFELSNGGNITVKAGATTGNTSAVTITPINGFSGTVALSCAVTTKLTAPQYPPTCSLSASSVSLSGASAQKVVLTIKTTAGIARFNQAKIIFWPSAGGAALALLFLFRVPGRRRGWMAMLGVLALAACAACIGCNNIIYGNGNGSSGTTAGAYTVTVTGTSGSTSQETALTIAVN